MQYLRSTGRNGIQSFQTLNVHILTQIINNSPIETFLWPRFLAILHALVKVHVNSKDLVRVIRILLHALDTILTYANSCLGVKSKNVFILRINLSPYGHNQWKFDMILPIFSSEGNSNHNSMNANDLL